MKILILYSYNKGYLSSFFFELSSKLIMEGHEVFNFSLKGEPTSFVKNDISIIIKKKGGYINNYFQIFKTINSIKPDIVLSNFSFVNPALLFGKLSGIKKNIVWFHSLNEQMVSSKLDIFIKKQFLKMADVVIANSFLTKKELHTIYKVPNEKLSTVPFWSDISESKLSEDTKKFEEHPSVFKIGCPGRLVAHKNHKIVIEAVSKIKKSGSFECKLYIAGDGEEFNHLEKLMNTLDLENNVVFLNHVSSEDMIAFYKTMDVVVLPSLHEAFGLVFIEAISLGTPVIVSNQFGALSFINETSMDSLTFNPQSSDELVEKLVCYQRNQHLSSSDFKQLYKDNFDKNVIFDQINSIMTGDISIQ